LIEEHVLTREEVEEALATEPRTGESLGEFALRKHPGEEEKVGRLLAEAWGLPFVASADLRVDPDAVERLPLALARDLEALPVGFRDDALVVAVAQPRRELFVRILEELGRTWFVVVPGSVLESLLSQPTAVSAGGEMPASVDTATAAVDAVHDELRAARDELRSARAELARLGEVEAELRAAREELARLEEAVRTEVPARSEEVGQLPLAPGSGMPYLRGLTEHGAP
jgi:hypothetical protein